VYGHSRRRGEVVNRTPEYPAQPAVELDMMIRTFTCRDAAGAADSFGILNN
jgi:hypothetical protein